MSNIARIRELADNYKRSIGTSSYDEAKKLYESAAREMLPGLVAVAEAASKSYNRGSMDWEELEQAISDLERVQLS